MQKRKRQKVWWTWAKRRWELLRVQTLTLVWPETLVHSHRLSSTLMRFHRIWTCSNFSWESSTKVMIVDESWRKLSWEPTISNSHPRLARDLVYVVSSRSCAARNLGLWGWERRVQTSQFPYQSVQVTHACMCSLFSSFIIWIIL